MALYVDIQKQYKDFLLRVKFKTDGKIFGVLGASGCGKSLTLKCIAGIEKPDCGIIELDGKILFDSKSNINISIKNRRVGYLFQDYALFPNMTVFQNIMCGARDKTIAKKYIDLFELSDKASLYPSQLSGGQRQRTAMARMLATRPQILLLDEPFTALDNYLKLNLESQILDMLEGYDGPIIFVSHNIDEVYQLTDNIAIMHEGSIVDIQKKEDMFLYPRTLAAARLVGFKNITALEKTDQDFIARDWGIRIYNHDKAVRDPGFAAIASDALELLEADDGGENNMECEVCRVIMKDINTVILLLKNRNDTVFYCELSKAAYERLGNDRIFVKIPYERVIFLRESQ